MKNRKKAVVQTLSPSDESADYFDRFARWSARGSGSPVSFFLAILTILTWACTGPFFGFSDTWQLVINTGTTIVTFLMVFLIQNAQNRDGQAIQLKLNELLRAVDGAHTALLNIEELSGKELDQLKLKYEDLASTARNGLQKGKTDLGCPEVRVEVKTNERKK